MEVFAYRDIEPGEEISINCERERSLYLPEEQANSM